MVDLPSYMWLICRIAGGHLADRSMAGPHAAEATGQFGRGAGPVSLAFCDGLVHGYLPAYQQCGNAASGASQSGSQRAPASGHANRGLASVVPDERHTGRHGATSGGWVELIWEQEAAGSNPATPTEFFEYTVRPVSIIRAGASGCLALHDVAHDRSATACVGFHCGSPESLSDCAHWLPLRSRTWVPACAAAQETGNSSIPGRAAPIDCRTMSSLQLES